MLGEDKNLKDSNLSQDLALKDTHISISYSKFNKLVIALYMVTDILENGEPLKNKLRTLGTQIISDINSTPIQAVSKITEVMTFLDIASAVNLISEMNFNILKKEFTLLEQSIREYGKVKSVWLEDFLLKSGEQQSPSEQLASRRAGIGHSQSSRTREIGRIGVQKGSTLMKALSDKTLEMSEIVSSNNNFDLQKKQRRGDILRIVQTTNTGLTITDIKALAKGLVVPASSLISCSEKTLQRELASMVKDGVLKKTGEKRWSKYFIQ